MSEVNMYTMKVVCPIDKWGSVSFGLCNALSLFDRGDFNDLDTDWYYGFFNDDTNREIVDGMVIWTANDFVFMFDKDDIMAHNLLGVFEDICTIEIIEYIED